MTIEDRIRIFKVALLEPQLSDEIIVQRHIIHPPPFVFNGDNDKYFALKSIISDFFNINPEEVKMVGSAKLGFSIVPFQLWKPFDDSSDIDMVIVSSKVFDDFWRDLYDFNIHLTVRTQEEQDMYYKFLDYFFKGWIRPDLFPFRYPQKRKWFTFFKSISYGKFGQRKVTGAIYKNMEFFEKYHTLNIRRLRSGRII